MDDPMAKHCVELPLKTDCVELPDPNDEWEPLSDEEIEDDENMVADNFTVLLLGLEDDIGEEDLLDYFQKLFKEPSADDCGWVKVKRYPDNGMSCGYAMIQLCVAEVRDLVIEKKHRIKSSWVTALLPSPLLGTYPIAKQCEIPEDKGKTFSTERILCPGPRTIYVGGFSGFPDLVDAYHIGNYFSQYGAVEAVELPLYIYPRDPKYPPKFQVPLTCGWALVLFALKESVVDVLAKSPHIIYGLRVFVYPTDGATLEYPLLETEDAQLEIKDKNASHLR